MLILERALDFNIILDDVAITELAFSPQYSAAVEAKQVAAQEAQRASFLVEKAKQQRQEKIVQAEGEAKSAKLVCLRFSSKNITNCNVVNLASGTQRYAIRVKATKKKWRF